MYFIFTNCMDVRMHSIISTRRKSMFLKYIFEMSLILRVSFQKVEWKSNQAVKSVENLWTCRNVCTNPRDPERVGFCWEAVQYVLTWHAPFATLFSSSTLENVSRIVRCWDRYKRLCYSISWWELLQYRNEQTGGTIPVRRGMGS